ACSDRPVYEWDVVEGLRAANKAAEDTVERWQSEAGVQSLAAATRLEPVGLLRVSVHAPENTLILMHNAQRFLDNTVVMQGTANLRDKFKLNFRTLVLLGPHVKLPPELQGDVLSYDEPYPTP